MTDYSEKRAHDRTLVSCNAEFRIKGDTETHEGQVVNISKGGVFFISHKEAMPTHEIHIKITPGDGCSNNIYASLEVIRCFPSGSKDEELYGLACAIWKTYDESEIGSIFP